MLERVAEIIKIEFEVFEGDESVSETLRNAAWNALEEFPLLKASEFGDAAALCGRHRQGAINRWNEAMHNLAVAEGRV